MSEPRALNWVERRAIVLDRANYECAECGATATEADHMWPRKHGGTDEFDNLQALCRRCNASKGDALQIKHMTARRLGDAATLRIVEAIHAAHEAVRFLSIADLLSEGWDPDEAHDEVGTDPAGFHATRLAFVADFISSQVNVKLDLPDAPERVDA